jgi:hypothetical protein
MPSIADLRKKLPYLDGLDDQQAVNVIQQVYYPSVSRDVLAQRLGVQAPEAPPPSDGIVRRMGDVGLSLAKGVIEVPEAAVGLADLATGGRVGKMAEAMGYRPKEAREFLDQYYSDSAKAAQQKVNDAKGIVDTTVAALQNPSVIVNSAAESLPSMGLGGVIGRGAVAIAPRMSPVIAGAIGEGAVSAGQNAEQVREEGPNGTLTGKQSAILAASGALTGGLSLLGGKVAQKLGIHDVDTMLATAGKSDAARKGIVRSTIEGALSEGILEEMPQSVQEQVAQNLAQGKPLDDGVDQQAVLGALTGGLMGGGANALHGAQAAPQKLPETGPMSRAVNAGIDSGAVAFQPVPVPAAKPAEPAIAEPSSDSIPFEADPRFAQAPAADIAIGEGGLLGTHEAVESQPGAFEVRPIGTSAGMVAPGVYEAAPTPAAPQRQLERPAPVEASPPAAANPAPETLAPGPAAAAPQTKGPFSSVQEAEGYISQQRRAASANLPVALPIEHADGSVGVATSGSPDFETAKQQDVTRQRAAAGILDGDVMNASGSPFKNQGAARRALKANPGTVIAEVKGGWVLRKGPADVSVDVAAGRGAGDSGDGGRSEPAGGEQAAGRAPVEPVPAVPAGADAGGAEVAPVRDGQQRDDAAVVDAAAHEAATSPTNDLPQPTEAQREAGNFKMGHAKVSGLDVTVEYPKGSERTGTSASGEQWRRPMNAHYGYIKRTEGADGENVDVYVGPSPDAPKAYVVDQTKADGSFDEHKVMLGYRSMGAARKAYLSHYPKGWKVGAITEAPVEDFKAWLRDGDATKPFASSTAPKGAQETAAPEPQSAAEHPGENHGEEGQGRRQEVLTPGAPEAGAPAPTPDRKPRKTKREPETVEDRTPPVIADAGEKIGGARKDRWKERGLSVADLDAMSESEGAELATKANVWKPDYAAMVAGGTPPKHAALVKVVYDRLAAQPARNTPEGRRAYVQMMQAVRAAFGSLDGTQDPRRAMTEARDNMLKAIGMHSRDTAEVQKAKQLLFSVYKGRSEPFQVFYDEERRADKMVRDGFPGKVEPWTRRFVLRDAGGAGTTDAGVGIYREASEKLGTPLADEQIKAGFFQVRSKAGQTVAMLPTKADAEVAAKRLYEATLAKESTEEPERPHLDKLSREGLPKSVDRDVTADDFLKHFGFRGVEFGNWSAQDERQKLLNLSYDGLTDLASILNVPPKALSLNGTLGMAFGARGGGRFAAHYEPGKLVINMTKIRGGGSLAHEWAHALDHYLGELAKDDAYKTSARGASGWMQRMVYDRGQQKKLAYEPGTRKMISVATPRLTNLRTELAESIDNVMQTMFGADRQPTSYAREAQKLSGKSEDGYWIRPTEMWARAFESYVFDRLLAMGAKSEYLVHGVEPDRFAAADRYKGNPYPVGAERAEINKAFDRFVGELKSRDTDNGVALYSRGAGRGLSADAVEKHIRPIVDSWANGPKGGVEVVKKAGELPANVLKAVKAANADGVAKAFFVPGTEKVYLIASNLESTADAEFALFHEVYGHYGMRSILGDDYAQAMTRLRRQNQNLAMQASMWMSRYGADEVKARVKSGMDKLAAEREVRLLSTEEALADAAAAVPELKGWKYVAARVQAFLRKIGLHSIADWMETRTEAETLQFLVRARRGVQGGMAGLPTGEQALFSRDDERHALQALSQNDDLFALPKSDKTTVEGIAADVDPEIKVKKRSNIPGETRYDLTMPDGKTARLMVREPNPYGQSTYGFDYVDGEMSSVYNERPGENPEDVPPKGDVWIDVSLLESGGGGTQVYAIAANYAHNTDRIFIGDPAGLSDEAMMRRPEQMLSSALKFGTTEHLAPHPRQVAGDEKLGVPPLRWVYGDDPGNIRRLVDLNLKTLENAGLSDAITFDPTSGQFLDSEGQPIDRAGIDAVAVEARLGERARAGGRTLARSAVLRALLREEGGGAQGADRGRDGLLARLARLGDDTPEATRRLFYSRGTGYLDTLRSAGTARAFGEAFHDLSKTQRGFNWWHRSVGTQYHKAQANEGFKRVYERAQDYLHDTSAFANDAAEYAKDLLPQLKSLRDLGRRIALPEKDREAIAAPIYDGTLRYTRDADGNLQEAGEGDHAGVVFTDNELRERFGLDDRQIGLYHQYRAAIDRSLDIMTASDVARLMGEALPKDMRQMVSEGDTGRFKGLVTALLADRIEKAGGPQEKSSLEEMRKLVTEKYDRIDQLKNEGYAPLMRFGRYTVDVTRPGNDGSDRVFFGMYESQREANAAARQFAKDDGVQVTQGVMSKEDYKLFAGMSPETLALFADLAGVEKNDAFQKYLQLAKANRSAMKRLIHRKGVAGFSEDVTRSLAQFITSNARASSGNLHMGEMENAVAAIPREQGDVRDEAMRLKEYVQNPQEEAQQIRGLLFAQYLGGSVASAMVNMTQPLTMTLPYLSQFGGAGQAMTRLVSAMKQAAGKVDAKSELGQALAKAEKEGIVSPQEIHQLQAESSRSMGNHPWVRKTLFLWGSLFQLAEQFNRRSSFIAAYDIAKAQGMADPFAFAAKAVDETQGVYNKGNRPNWARGALGSTLFTFKQFSIGYLEFLARLPMKERALALAVLLLAAGAQGLPFADDVDDLADALAQRMGYDFNSKRRKERFLASVLGQGGADFVLHGFSALPGMPLDVSARMGVGNLIPGTGMLLKSEKDASKDFAEIAGPAGNLVTGARDLAVNGNARALMPTAIANLSKALEMYQTGQYRDTRGRKVMDVGAGDAVTKALGFQPQQVASDSRKRQVQAQQNNLAKQVQAEIVQQWAAGIVDGEPDQVKAARDRVAKWNRDNPESRIAVSPAAVAGRAREMRRDADERAVRGAPKTMRADARAVLQ